MSSEYILGDAEKRLIGMLADCFDARVKLLSSRRGHLCSDDENALEDIDSFYEDFMKRINSELRSSHGWDYRKYIL